jgi:3-oxoacyl-[acyl-carrier protein] reductase
VKSAPADTHEGARGGRDTPPAVLVTGSTRGIGLAIARRLAAGGATVGLHGRSPERVEALCRAFADLPGTALGLAADFADPRTAGALVRDFHERAGRLDGLVNNAGGGRAVAFRGITLEAWRRTFAVDVDAAMEASREAYVLMRRVGAGAIVNIASLAAHGPGKWMGADYAAAKAALVSLTRSLAFEAARFGIRVNAVSPGLIATDMTAALSPAMVAGLRIPLGRLGRAEEAAAAATFLLSDAAGYMTGQVLHVNGGLWM